MDSGKRCGKNKAPELYIVLRCTSWRHNRREFANSSISKIYRISVVVSRSGWVASSTVPPLPKQCIVYTLDKPNPPKPIRDHHEDHTPRHEPDRRRRATPRPTRGAAPPRRPTRHTSRPGSWSQEHSGQPHQAPPIRTGGLSQRRAGIRQLMSHAAFEPCWHVDDGAYRLHLMYLSPQRCR